MFGKSSHKTLAALVVFAAALLALAASASARTISVYTHQPTVIDGAETTAGTLCFVTSLDVRQIDGRLFVMDPCRYDSAITQFAPDGTPQVFSGLTDDVTSVSMHSEGGFQVAVDNSGTASNGNFYGLNFRNTLKGFKPDGTELGGNFPLSGFLEGCGVTVDPQGDIWIAHSFSNKLTEYTSLGVATGKFVASPRPCRSAIDAQGNFYIGERFSNVRKYDPEGSFLYALNAGPSRALTVDRSNGHVYVVETDNFVSPHVQEYDAEGNPLAAFAFAEGAFLGLEEGDPMGIAIRETSKEVFVTNPHSYNGAQHVEVFKPTGQATVPTVTTDEPGLTTSSATLKGTIDLDGGGDTIDCHFEWGTLAGFYENSLPCTPPNPISGAGIHQITANLPGLTQGTRYHFRLVAKNANGILAYGPDRAF